MPVASVALVAFKHVPLHGFWFWSRSRAGGDVVAEADGNRTRLTEVLGHVGFEDRGGHQAPIRLRAVGYAALAGLRGAGKRRRGRMLERLA